MSDERLVQEVLAKYARAVDARDAGAVAERYEPTGRERLSYNRSGTPEPIAEFEGAEAIRHAVATILPAHPHLGWAHHTTFDPIIVVDGDTAELDAQFVVYSVQGDERPVSGWPLGATGGQGRIRPVESGYYHLTLRRATDGWKIVDNHTILDLPPALP
ncbi:MAG: hypothetical protein QOG99_2121 [Frankiales bacterium]|nr:hypothetical protein [Frankiales bacterium]